jgi:hypothetical protein
VVRPPAASVGGDPAVFNGLGLMGTSGGTDIATAIVLIAAVTLDSPWRCSALSRGVRA